VAVIRLLDAWLADYIARPVLRLFQWCDRLERAWTDFLSGRQSRESDLVRPSAGTLDDFETVTPPLAGETRA
jgi:hypothetical protein